MHAESLVSRLPRWAVIRDARRRQRRRWRRRAFVLALVAAVGAGLLAQRSPARRQNPLASASAQLNSVDVGGYVLGAQSSRAHIWVLTCVRLCGAGDTGLDSERLVELDASSGAVIRRLAPLTNVSALTTAGRNVWVAHPLSGRVTRIDPATGRATAQVNLRLPVQIAPGDRQFRPSALSASGNSVWASTERGWIARIDAVSGRVEWVVRTPSENNSTTTDRYGTWVAEDLDGVGLLAPHRTRLRVRAVMQAGLPLEVSHVLSGAGVVWAIAVTNQWGTATRTVILELNPRTHRVVRRVQVPEAESTDAVVAVGALYLGDLVHGRIYRVTPSGPLQIFRTPRHLAWLATSTPGALWAATSVSPGHGRGRLLRIGLPLG